MRTLIIMMLFPGASWASEAEDQLGANLLAMGSTGVANAGDASAVTLNPGVMGLERQYDLQGQFRYGDHPNLGWGVSILDSKTSERVAGGAAYHRTAGNPPLHPDELPGWSPAGDTPTNAYSDHNITLAYAVPFAENRIALGMNGTLSIENHERLGKSVTGNLDVGLGSKPVEALTLGLVGRNLLPIQHQGNRPAALEGGIRVQHPELGHAIEVDVGGKLERMAAGSPLRVGAGVQGQVKVLALRGGYRYEGAETRHYVTAGMGLANESGAVEYGVAIPVSDFEALDMIHQLSVRIHVKLPGDEDWEDL